jgi:NAD(P)-dependent dehydrogenase (short-subunit alcohol dehydrogenase family)
MISLHLAVVIGFMAKFAKNGDQSSQAALFLACDGASFMTGADLLVDGGYTAV